MEKGIAASCMFQNQTPQSQWMFRVAAGPARFSRVKIQAAAGTP
jgi:hypothetical protein